MSEEESGKSRPPSSFEGTYAPGAILAERYRIVALIGEGGMGEVYLADDQTLGQEVAIKFLPARLAEREGFIERFHGEVRIARTVTHSNVARVHDIGEVDGRHFFTMEYVDGEDLAHLLKRIGRFPREKAVDLAQQMCAGLAAAHERGVVHRDLKPANVMVDGEGRVKITDFGLSAVAGEKSNHGGISGTPAYMSPEQIQGGQVTERSEVYSLGLVLYELFTGKRVFDGTTLEELRRQHGQETPSSPSSILADIDPAVERVIMRCLEKEPARRPPSVRAVALALPGGDPLAAAVAAGETPAPELVAEAGERGGLSVPAALGCLALFLAALALVVKWDGRTQLTAMVPLPHPPEVLVDRARDVLDSIGFTEVAADSLAQFYRDGAQLEWIEDNDDSPERWEQLANRRPSVLSLLYRQGPSTLVASEVGPFHSGRASDPPHETPAMVRMRIYSDGTLESLSIVPPARSGEAEQHPAFDWNILFEASGLDPTAFHAVTPEWTRDVPTEQRFAWEGVYPGTELAARIEAGSFAGKPVSWRVLPPWNVTDDPVTGDDGLGGLMAAVIVIVMVVVLGGAIALARRNVRLKRGDRKGAFRLAIVVLSVQMLAWLLGDHHVASMDELNLFFGNLGEAVFGAAFVWLFYLALEPSVRKLWPQRLTSWVRLLDGRWKDPLVGRDLLLAGLLGAGMTLCEQAWGLTPGWLGGSPLSPSSTGYSHIEAISLLGGRHFLAVAFGSVGASLTFSLALVVTLIVLRLLLRKQWAAVLGLVAIYMLPSFQDTPLAALFIALQIVLFLFALLRFGLLTALAGMQLHYMMTGFPMILAGSSWFLIYSVLGLVLIAAPVTWGAYTALAGRSLFADLEAD